MCECGRMWEDAEKGGIEWHLNFSTPNIEAQVRLVNLFDVLDCSISRLRIYHD